MELQTDGTETRYRIRPYEPGDGAALLSLRERVWGQSMSREWFRWKYVENPFVDEVPMVVAEADGEVVGIRPFTAYRMQVGASAPVALQATDTMVHPDHRRQGLFTRMTERAVERYTDRGPAFVFNFPNGRSLPGYLDLGWRDLRRARTYYRVQDPGALLGGSQLPLGPFAGRAVAAAMRGYDRVREYAAPEGDHPVTRDDGVRSAELATVAGDGVPRKIHARRDEQFYDWRFADPRWDRATTYLAHDGDDAVAGAVVQTRTTERGVRKTVLSDLVPLDGSRRAAVASLLARTLADSRGSDVVVAPGRVLPASLLRSFGFLGDHVPPYSLVADQRFTLVTRSLRPGTWSVDGVALDDPSNWHLSLAERPYYY